MFTINLDKIAKICVSLILGNAGAGNSICPLNQKILSCNKPDGNVSNVPFVICDQAGKMAQVGTKYIYSQNVKHLGLCVHYLLSVSCKMLLIKLFINDTNVTLMASSDHLL